MRPPGDKSISHRYALLAALADGVTRISGYSTGADCASTLSCLRSLGTDVRLIGRDESGLSLEIEGRGLGGLRVSEVGLDAGNSGSTMRMLAGILAAHPFSTAIRGDESLMRRPMGRIIVPLERMGARIASEGGRPPLIVQGTGAPLAIDFTPDVPSAQVKSAVLLAGLHSDGHTRVREALPTRDHTERAFEAFGVQTSIEGTSVAVRGRQRLLAGSFAIPGDISSAAFWMVAAASVSGSEIVITHVGLNPTRSGVIDVLRRMGADILVERQPGPGEPVGTLVVRHGGLGRTVVRPDEVPNVIDELPVLAALATHGGELSVSGAGELRVKESDRISSLAEGLRRMGAEIDEQPDGFHVRGHRRLHGGDVHAHEDHRLAMAFAIAALGATGPTTIHGAGAAAVSYPEFFTVLDSLRA